MANTLLGNQTSGIQSAISQKTGLSAIVSKTLAIAAPMVMSYIGKMFTEQKMDQRGLSFLGEQSKMVMQSSPDAAAIAKQFFPTEEKSSGIMGWLKKLFGS